MAGRTGTQGARADDRAALREQHPDSWIPLSPGDEIIGQVIDVQEAWSEQRAGGSYYPLLIVKTEQATGYEIPAKDQPPLELKIHAFGAVMFNEVMRRQPEVGERVRFTYTGDREPTPENKAKGHSPTRLFRLDVAGRQDAGKRAYSSLGQHTEQRRGNGANPPVSSGDFGTVPPADDDVPF